MTQKGRGPFWAILSCGRDSGDQTMGTGPFVWSGRWGLRGQAPETPPGAAAWDVPASACGPARRAQGSLCPRKTPTSAMQHRALAPRRRRANWGFAARRRPAAGLGPPRGAYPHRTSGGFSRAAEVGSLGTGPRDPSGPDRTKGPVPNVSNVWSASRNDPKGAWAPSGSSHGTAPTTFQALRRAERDAYATPQTPTAPVPRAASEASVRAHLGRSRASRTPPDGPA